jgi:probable HAF family extracellular repeat protein
MKSRFSNCITAIPLLIALAFPPGLAGQDIQDRKHNHHHYQLIDLGTLGGPLSLFPPFQQTLSNRGTVAGCADTPVADANYPNFNPYLTVNVFAFPVPDANIFHGFQWERGSLTDLGALPGVNSSCVNWLNDNGAAAGLSENRVIDPLTGWPEVQAVLWENGQITSLGTLGGNESFASAMNNRDQVVGPALNAIPDPISMLLAGTQTRAFLWDAENGMQDLGTLGGPDAFAAFINERGEVAGFSFTDSTSSPPLHAFIWKKNRGMRDLGTLGGTYSQPFAINKRGQVVGASDLEGGSVHPFFWDRGRLRDLGTFGGSSGVANFLNDAGEVVGFAYLPDQSFHGFLWKWKHGGLTDLGTVDGDPCSEGWGINSKGQVVGHSGACDFSSIRATLWEDGGPMIDLNTLVAPGSGLQLLIAHSINDRGEIAGDGILANGDSHTFLLIPCDEIQTRAQGCENGSTSAMTQSEAAYVAHNATTLTQGSPSSSDTMAAIRSRFAHRYPYRGFGTYQPK